MDNGAFKQYLQQQNNILAQYQTQIPQSTPDQQQQQPNALSNLASAQSQEQNALAAYQAHKSGNMASVEPNQSAGDNSFAGQCQKFAEQATFGHSGIFPSAIAAAQHYAQNGQLNPDIQKAPAGSLIYFAPDTSNQGYGHVGVADGKGNFTSATYNGVKTLPLSNWIQSTKQQPLGYVIPK